MTFRLGPHDTTRVVVVTGHQRSSDRRRRRLATSTARSTARAAVGEPSVPTSTRSSTAVDRSCSTHRVWPRTLSSRCEGSGTRPLGAALVALGLLTTLVPPAMARTATPDVDATTAPRHRRVLPAEGGLTVACQAIVVTQLRRCPRTGPARPVGVGPVRPRRGLRVARPRSSTWVWNGRKVIIVDAYDNPHAEFDLAVYRQTFGLPPCTVANGCFKKISQQTATPLPSGDVVWGQEIDLDLQMASAICPLCKITLVAARSASLPDITSRPGGPTSRTRARSATATRPMSRRENNAVRERLRPPRHRRHRKLGRQPGTRARSPRSSPTCRSRWAPRAWSATRRRAAGTRPHGAGAEAGAARGSIRRPGSSAWSPRTRAARPAPGAPSPMWPRWAIRPRASPSTTATAPSGATTGTSSGARASAHPSWRPSSPSAQRRGAEPRLPVSGPPRLRRNGPRCSTSRRAPTATAQRLLAHVTRPVLPVPRAGRLRRAHRPRHAERPRRVLAGRFAPPAEAHPAPPGAPSRGRGCVPSRVRLTRPGRPRPARRGGGSKPSMARKTISPARRARRRR